MSAFLVPADKLARVLPKHASATDLLFRWRAAQGLSGKDSGRSVPFVDLDPSEGTLGLLVDDLAEAFGVTTAFMSVRLAKGGFIGRRLETGSPLSPQPEGLRPERVRRALGRVARLLEPRRART